ncbi:MAG: hypothetical protein JO279_01490 [Verrucomicrobia bacterium]|nr:hypothetical protein [Verrucomicrobiota bacterium]
MLAAWNGRIIWCNHVAALMTYQEAANYLLTLTVQVAAGCLKISPRIRNLIKSGKLSAKQFDKAGLRIRKLDLEHVADRDI